MEPAKIVKRATGVFIAAVLLSPAGGARAARCSFSLSAAPSAVLLPLTAAAAQRIQVGTVVQDCGDKASYRLIVASGNCLQFPAGAKLKDPATAEYVRYSVEFDNPASGGSSPIVAGLLAASCGDAAGRDVVRARVEGESSLVFINFTGSNLLAAGTYADTLSVTLSLN